MASNGYRIRDLLYAERDGNLSTAQQDAIATLRDAGKFPDPLQGPSAPQESIGGILTRNLAATPGRMVNQAVSDAATFARMAPGAIPNPLIAAPASAAGEAAAQGIEYLAGRRSEPDYLQMGIAAAVPPAAAGAGRLVRGAIRTGTRIIPSWFKSAQEGALTGARELGSELAPEAGAAGEMFKAARAAGNEVVPASNTATILADLEKSIPAKPGSPGLEVARKHMANVAEALQSSNPYNVPAGVGTTAPGLTLESLLKLRRDLGMSINRAPEIGALYKGLMQDLSDAAAAGGPGAEIAQQALKLYKQGLGATKVQDLVEAATTTRNVLGADTKTLDMAKLSKAIGQNSAELTELLGARGMQLVGAFKERFKSLPPDVAYNGWGRLLGAIFGAGGLAGGIATGTVVTPAAAAAAGALGLDAAVNAFLVGKNTSVNSIMQMLAQGARAGVVAAPPSQSGGAQ